MRGPILGALPLMGAMLLASCDGWEVLGPPAPDVSLTPEQVRAVRMKGGWGPLPSSAEDVRLFVYDPGTEFETQFIRFRARNDEADALFRRLFGERTESDAVNCLEIFSKNMAWWPKDCPEGIIKAQRQWPPDYRTARAFSQRGPEKTTMWLALGAGWH